VNVLAVLRRPLLGHRRFDAFVVRPFRRLCVSGCAFPKHTKRVHAAVTGPKALVWGDGSQIDFYDQPRAVGFAVDAVRDWFERTL
jgi:hypothetical protein